jgi:hypothetical protein
LIAIVDIALGVNHHHPVSVSIQRNPEVGTLCHDSVTQGSGSRGTDFLVDVEAVRFGADAAHLGAQFVEDMRCDVVSRTVCAVDNDFQPPQSISNGKVLLQNSI